MEEAKMDRILDIGRSTQFGRPTFSDNDGGLPIQKTSRRRWTSDQVRTSDASDVRNPTDVRRCCSRTSPRLNSAKPDGRPKYVGRPKLPARRFEEATTHVSLVFIP